MATKPVLTVTTDPPSIKEATSGVVILHVEEANILVYKYDWSVADSDGKSVPTNKATDDTAQVDISNLPPGIYTVTVTATDKNSTKSAGTGIGSFTIELDFLAIAKESTVTEGETVHLGVGKSIRLRKRGAIFPNFEFTWLVYNDKVTEVGIEQWEWDTSGLQPGTYEVSVTTKDKHGNAVGERTTDPIIVKQRKIQKGDVFPVTLRRTAAQPTSDQGFWAAIRNRTEAISFKRYNDFIKGVFCEESVDQAISDVAEEYGQKFTKDMKRPKASDLLDARLSIHAVDAYNVLKLATEVFLLLECGVARKKDGKIALLDPELFDQFEESGRFGEPVALQDIETRLTRYFGGKDKIPYLDRILNALLGLDSERQTEKLPYCDGVLQYRSSCPSLLELIWSYWHEEGMLVQSMNVIALRFQNRRGHGDRDPLAELEIDPLRPLNNLFWGYIQNEYNRLTVTRRTYEYDHHYGLTLYGKAVPQLRSADSRSKFLEAFHHLLCRTAIFYREDADTTVVADAFPLLNALREVHLVLAEGAHNQFGDLPWTARVEMLIEQWLLARPEMQEFLRGRQMVPYREEWMGRVDAMKKLQGWTDVSITHFQELATYGEQILLTVRYGDWIDVNDEDQAKNWARYWKPEIQSYIHAYRAATGVDLTTEPVDATPPWVHLRRQEEQKKARRM